MAKKKKTRSTLGRERARVMKIARRAIAAGRDVDINYVKTASVQALRQLHSWKQLTKKAIRTREIKRAYKLRAKAKEQGKVIPAVPITEIADRLKDVSSIEQLLKALSQAEVEKDPKLITIYGNFLDDAEYIPGDCIEDIINYVEHCVEEYGLAPVARALQSTVQEEPLAREHGYDPVAAATWLKKLTSNIEHELEYNENVTDEQLEKAIDTGESYTTKLLNKYGTMDTEFMGSSYLDDDYEEHWAEFF